MNTEEFFHPACPFRVLLRLTIRLWGPGKAVGFSKGLAGDSFKGFKISFRDTFPGPTAQPLDSNNQNYE